MVTKRLKKGEGESRREDETRDELTSGVPVVVTQATRARRARRLERRARRQPRLLRLQVKSEKS
jgi:hypothetical protein